MNEELNDATAEETGRPLVLAPSILAADFSCLADEVDKVAPASDWLHLDVMDGHFVPNITFGPDVVAAIRRHTDLPLDVHLMIERPERHVQRFVDAGADVLTVHVEASPHLHRTVQMIRDAGCRAGVALNPHTPVSMIEHVLGGVDLILLMTVNPGFGGQRFLPEVLPKIDELMVRLDRADKVGAVDVQVDGGINRQTGAEVKARGANVLVAGSYVFGAPDARQALADLR